MYRDATVPVKVCLRMRRAPGKILVWQKGWGIDSNSQNIYSFYGGSDFLFAGARLFGRRQDARGGFRFSGRNTIPRGGSGHEPTIGEPLGDPP